MRAVFRSTGGETKRTLDFFLSCSHPRNGSITKREIRVMDDKPLTSSSSLGKGSTDRRPLVTKLQYGIERAVAWSK